MIRKIRKVDSTKVTQSGYNSNNIFEIKKREPNRKMETLLSLMAFLLIQQTVGENIGSEEDPYIEGGKTIIVKWKLVLFFENTNVSYQKALKGIILGRKYVYLKDFTFAYAVESSICKIPSIHKIHLKYFTINIFSV